MRIPFVPKKLQQWVHPDTVILGAIIGFAGVGCAWFAFRTLFTHTDISFNKNEPYKFASKASERLYPRARLVEGKYETMDRPRTAKYQVEN